MGRNWRLIFLEKILGDEFSKEFEQKENYESIFDYALDDLTPREKQMIVVYYGEGKPASFISNEFGITNQRVYQIMRKAERKMKHSYKLKSNTISRETKMYDLMGCGIFQENVVRNITSYIARNTDIVEDWMNAKDITLGNIIDLINDGFDFSPVRNVGEIKLQEFLNQLQEVRKRFKV